MVSLDTGKQMMFGGTEEPCAYGELISIGSLGGGKNKNVSATLLSKSIKCFFRALPSLLPSDNSCSSCCVADQRSAGGSGAATPGCAPQPTLHQVRGVLVLRPAPAPAPIAAASSSVFPAHGCVQVLRRCTD